MSLKVLVAEDDSNIANLVRLYLSKEGYFVLLAKDGQEALEIYQSQQPDMLILDIMMPRLDGWEIIRKVRGKSGIPIIVLTARDEEADKVLGLELGADDYVTKPFSPRELVARVRALCRRYCGTASASTPRYTFPGLSIDLEGREVVCASQTISLTPKEFELLACLARHPGRVFSRGALLEQVWGYHCPEDDRTVNVHVKRLRQKLSNSDYTYIQTVWGVGYKFEVKPLENKSGDED
ncbi:MAG: response regulator transcription factor [Syntrophothermus sp.]|uniref:response regulator transcription factor n=1 Tax=Syntrophothermus sp. TaxID=2736299 RepID=UPI00257E82A9|nr:response regulator transcription factor [Syntrophothermus sp.]NSW81924.1 response regulator transcription factor [Syntrophothermus sp.]